MHVGEGQATYGMKLAHQEIPERDLEKQTPHFRQDARTRKGSLHQANTEAFPKPADWDRLQDCTQGLRNL